VLSCDDFLFGYKIKIVVKIISSFYQIFFVIDRILIKNNHLSIVRVLVGKKSCLDRDELSQAIVAILSTTLQSPRLKEREKL
jgi:hypothetical protein